MQVNILEAKSQLSRLIKSAQAGEDVVIANRGEPVARLVSIGAPASVAPSARQPGAPSGAVPPVRPGGILKWLEANPLPAYLQRTAEEIDTAIREERDSWE